MSSKRDCVKKPRTRSVSMKQRIDVIENQLHTYNNRLCAHEKVLIYIFNQHFEKKVTSIPDEPSADVQSNLQQEIFEPNEEQKLNTVDNLPEHWSMESPI